MGGSAATCPPDPNDPCKSLAEKINELINAVRQKVRSGTKGLKQRFDEQVHGNFGPGTPQWDSHEEEIETQQERLRKFLKTFGDDDCTEKFPSPPDAWI